MNLLLNIKYAWQRVWRGYDDRVYYSFAEYFLQVIPAIEKFCKQKLHDKEYSSLNLNHAVIYTETLRLIKEWQDAPPDDYWRSTNAESRMLGYIGEHVSYFWS